MQVGGIGSGNSGFDNHGVSHRVTNGFHEHGTAKKQTGGAGLPSPAVPSSISAEQGAGDTASMWGSVREVLGSGRRLLARIWGGNEAAAAGESEEKGRAETADDAELAELLPMEKADVFSAGHTEMLTDMKRQHEGQIAAASANVQAPQSMITSNPYFTADSHTGKVKETLLQKIKVRFQNIADLLKKRFGGTLAGADQFSAKSSLADNKKQPKQDMRRRSRYKEEDVEIDCVITDDSYLMDSYDRHGKYTQLGSGGRRTDSFGGKQKI